MNKPYGGTNIKNKGIKEDVCKSHMISLIIWLNTAKILVWFIEIMDDT